ncbi:MAG: GntR family transcriptional regulator [Aeromonas allosaccharophila]
MHNYPDIQYMINSEEPINKQIYRFLRKEIIECQLLPGTLLSENEVSLRFSVSRQPVRETFIKLSEDGLIKIKPQRGSFVRKISIQSVLDGRFIRNAIECSVIKQAAKLATEKQILQLYENIKKQRIAVQNDLPSDFLFLDDQFHKLLSEFAGCSLAWHVIENIKANMDRVRYLSLSNAASFPCLLKQHEDIYTAIKNGDSEAAERTLQEHLSEIEKTINSVKSINAEWFEP